MNSTNAIAVDLGASSGRLISGTYDGEKVVLKEQFRFSNLPVQVVQDLHWDYMKILQEIKYGLSIADHDLDSLDSISVDTWGVDYGLVNPNGQLLMAPHSYRDTRVNAYEAQLYEVIPKFELFQKTGNQPEKINSILQLYADLQMNPYLQDEIQHVVFMPSLIAYFLSGEVQNEFTISSTSGLLDTETREFSQDVFQRLNFKTNWFGSLSKHGSDLSPLSSEVSKEINLEKPLQVVTGVGHDTAAALLALPVNEQDRAKMAFISCGTWSIVGQQTAQPVVTEKAFNAGLTNEGCFDGSNRLLKNLTGLWIIQELQREWSFKGEVVEFSQMVKEALAERSINSYIHPNNEMFATPNQMEEKIIAYLRQTDQKLPKNRGQLILIVLESLAFSYRQTIEQLVDISGKDIEKIHMFGGGIQNQLLVQLTANFTMKEVIVGPVEASVMGNVVSQLQIRNLLSTEETKQVMEDSYTVGHVQPMKVRNLEQKYGLFQSVTEIEEVSG